VRKERKKERKKEREEAWVLIPGHQLDEEEPDFHVLS
jgi:hypothetical protein